MDAHPDTSEPIIEDPDSELIVGELTANRLRQCIVEIDDQVRALPADAFAEKYRLQSEADELRRALSAAGGQDAGTLASWAERAAGKNSHTVDEDLELAKTKVFSPGQNSSR